MPTLDDATAPAIAPPIRDYLEGLNVAQRKAVEYGIGDDAATTPLLIIAGAGFGHDLATDLHLHVCTACPESWGHLIYINAIPA